MNLAHSIVKQIIGQFSLKELKFLIFLSLSGKVFHNREQLASSTFGYPMQL